MNTRYQVFEFSVEGRQVQEVVASVFHTLLFHRTIGKGQPHNLSALSGISHMRCHFKNEGNNYTVSTMNFEDVTCDFVDFTYVRCASEELNNYVSETINSFCTALRSQEGPYSGQISLEFYQKKKAWFFAPEVTSPWEVWTLKVNVISLPNEHGKFLYCLPLSIGICFYY
ncbi:UNVERIFIED_CONTAM: Autophagy-related protein [Trichonephila clavipes]